MLCCALKGNTDSSSLAGICLGRRFHEFIFFLIFWGFDAGNLKISYTSKCSKLRGLKKHIKMYRFMLLVGLAMH